MEEKFEQFIKEQRLLKNVTQATADWYEQSLAWLPNSNPSLPELKDSVLRMRSKDLKATGCNCRIRAINAYLHWLAGTNGKCSSQCQHARIPKLREPQLVLPTYTADQIKRILAFRPEGRVEKRMQLLLMILLDTGCRISEALDLRVQDCDLENLLLTLRGKGQKERKVPFSLVLRKALFRHTHELKPASVVLATNQGSKMDRHIVARDVKEFCKKLGFNPPVRALHAFRHTFALNYLRKGGSVFHLQKVLGHSSLDMTRRYVNLMTEDLQVVHEKLSLLS